MFVPGKSSRDNGNGITMERKMKKVYVEAFGEPELITLEELQAFDEHAFLSSGAADYKVPPPAYECCTEPNAEEKGLAHPGALWVGLWGEVPLWERGSVVQFGAYVSDYPTRNHALYAAKMLWVAAMKWNAADVGVQFRWVTKLADCAFVLRYNQREAGALARAFFPNDSDVNVVWVFPRAFKSKFVKYMDAVFEHEVGHVLGLRHEFAEHEGGTTLFGPRNQESVMSYNFPMRIQQTDVEWVRNLYSYSESHIGTYEVKRYVPDN
jgi:hypothetical protein